MSAVDSRRAHWSSARPWHTNLALLTIGFGLICFTRQLIAENDGFIIGNAATSFGSLALYLGALLIFLLRPSNTDKYTLPIILGIAVACRIVCLFNDPFLSSDVYRYAWDGVVQHAHISPYRYVPGNPVLSFLRAPNQDLFDNMNRRDYAHTIYPPVAQIAFYGITFLAPTVTGMKFAMVLFEALTVYGLILLLRRLGRPSEWVLLYAWCPIAIWEFSGSGHLDAMVMALVVFAMLFRFERRPLLTGLFLGLAIFTKFYPLVIFPALYQRRPDGKLDWKMPAMVVAVGVVTYSFYLSAGKLVFGFLNGYVEEEGLATGTRYFALEWAQHLPGLHALGNPAFLILAVCVFVPLLGWTWRTACAPESAPAAFLKPTLWLASAMMLLFSPHYPWYVAWLLPLVVLCPSLTVLTYLCVFQYLCYTDLATGYGPRQYQLNQILYAWVLVAAAIEITLHRLPKVRAWLAPLRLERAG